MDYAGWVGVDLMKWLFADYAEMIGSTEKLAIG